MMLYGRLIDARKLSRAKSKGEAIALVPSSWELVRKSPDGSETTLAQSVVAFDLCGEGNVVYTDGARIFHVCGSEKREIGRADLVERIAVLREAAATPCGADEAL
jgi:hypothetical protein